MDSSLELVTSFTSEADFPMKETLFFLGHTFFSSQLRITRMCPVFELDDSDEFSTQEHLLTRSDGFRRSLQSQVRLWSPGKNRQYQCVFLRKKVSLMGKYLHDVTNSSELLSGLTRLFYVAKGCQVRSLESISDSSLAPSVMNSLCSW